MSKLKRDYVKMGLRVLTCKKCGKTASGWVAINSMEDKDGGIMFEHECIKGNTLEEANYAD